MIRGDIPREKREQRKGPTDSVNDRLEMNLRRPTGEQGDYGRRLDEIVDDRGELLLLAEDPELSVGARPLGEDLADAVELVVRAEDIRGFGHEVERVDSGMAADDDRSS